MNEEEEKKRVVENVDLSLMIELVVVINLTQSVV